MPRRTPNSRTGLRTLTTLFGMYFGKKKKKKRLLKDGTDEM
jgi:hypothetical protein